MPKLRQQIGKPTPTPAKRKVAHTWGHCPAKGEFIAFAATERGIAKCLVHKKSKRTVLSGLALQQVITVSHLTVIEGTNSRGLIDKRAAFNTGAVIKSNKTGRGGIVLCINRDTAFNIAKELWKIDNKPQHLGKGDIKHSSRQRMATARP